MNQYSFCFVRHPHRRLLHLRKSFHFVLCRTRNEVIVNLNTLIIGH